MCQFVHGETMLGWLRTTRYFTTINRFAGKFHKLTKAMDLAATRSLRSHFPEGFDMAKACLNPQYAERLYDAWNLMVKNTTPPDRLLVFQTGKHGWKELCTFLGVDEPAVPYPHVNSKAEFQFVVKIFWAEVVMVYVVLPMLAILAVFLIMRRNKAKMA
eukprot:gnl/TRDRNA2_/TRDRNA2_206870_c0_seq1.p1 gnl/TRDRNA2_/TRDRNA2_206870_c0~~gnl/TRDRNA2_/TRDRNA2_206870_c0_seq1.p1  ORF type:complete len:159 (-),score=27.74 gnl/TRDRNA2_/TRDRNA2_206870_c0_seq1:97-573(-)